MLKVTKVLKRLGRQAQNKEQHLCTDKAPQRLKPKKKKKCNQISVFAKIVQLHSFPSLTVLQNIYKSLELMMQTESYREK